MSRALHASSPCSPWMWLSLIMVGGFLLRVGLLAAPGNQSDLGINQGWALSAVVHGTPDSYEHQEFNNMRPNYPPLSLSFFAGIGNVYNQVSPALERSPLLHSLIKLPGVIADMVICVMIFSFVRRVFDSNKALLGAAIAAFHPAAISNGAIWGQIDAVHSAFMLGFVMACIRERWFVAGVVLALGMLCKVQAAMLAPLVIVLTFTNRQSLWMLPAGTVAGVAAVLLPFALSGRLENVVWVFTHSVNYYPSVTMNAYNGWYAVFGGQNFPKSDAMLIGGIINLRAIGFLAFLGSSAVLLWATRPGLAGKLRSVLRDRSAALSIVAAGLAFAFFMLNTQMHERYLYPLVALGIPLVFLSWRWAAIYLLSTVLFTINMMAVIGGNPWVHAFLRSVPKAALVVAILQTALFAWFLLEAVLWRLRAMRA